MQARHSGFATGWNGVSLRYDVFGAGEPAIVCCNGLGVSTSYWKYIIPYFARTQRVVTWEYRGHYASQAPDPIDRRNLSMSVNAHDLAAVLDASKVRHAVLLGHSMGCQVLLEFWRLYRERVAALVPMCGAYGRPMDTFFLPPAITADLVQVLGKVTTTAPGLLEALVRPLLRSSLPYTVARWGFINPQLASPEDMAPYFANLSRMDLRIFLLMAAEMQDHDAGPWLDDIDKPTLIVAGECDTFTPLSLSKRMQKKIPGAELLLLPKGSHAGIIEHPELINLRLEKFMRERVAVRPGSAAPRQRARRSA